MEEHELRNVKFETRNRMGRYSLPKVPCPRVTTQDSKKCQSAEAGPPAAPGVYLKEIIVNALKKESLRGAKRPGNLIRLLHFVRNDPFL